MGFLSKYHEPAGEYAFHQTYRRNVESIVDKGILRGKTGLNTANINEVLEELGYVNPFPFERSNVTYCHVDEHYVEENHHSSQNSSYAFDEVVIVIAVSEINAPMYLADMSVLSDLLDYRYASSDMMMHSESPEEVIRLYQDSVVKVNGPEEIASNFDSGRGHTELVIDGDIPPKAIVDVCY